MLIPQTDWEEERMEIDPSATWQIDWTHHRIGGRIDQREALAQSIALRLQTELGQYLIYSDSYGLDRGEITGEQTQTMARRVSQCLAEEERVTGICDFSCQAEGDSCQIQFTANTIWGDAQVALEI